jgi:hypothetical protein
MVSVSFQILNHCIFGDETFWRRNQGFIACLGAASNSWAHAWRNCEWGVVYWLWLDWSDEAGTKMNKVCPKKKQQIFYGFPWSPQPSVLSTAASQLLADVVSPPNGPARHWAPLSSWSSWSGLSQLSLDQNVHATHRFCEDQYEQNPKNLVLAKSWLEISLGMMKRVCLADSMLNERNPSTLKSSLVLCECPLWCGKSVDHMCPFHGGMLPSDITSRLQA